METKPPPLLPIKPVLEIVSYTCEQVSILILNSASETFPPSGNLPSGLNRDNPPHIEAELSCKESKTRATCG